MLRHNPKIIDLIYESAIEKLASIKGITIQESRQEIAKMSFMQYYKLLEAGANITPPSGQAIGPSANSVAPSSQPQQAQTAPQKAQVMWAGQGTPIEQGMTVGLKGPNGVPVPGEITQVDQSAKGVKVRNPTTGQEELHGNTDLQPFTANSTAQSTPQSNALQQQMSEELSRMKQLAGIAEDASGGASCAGGMAASTPQPMGTIKRRTEVDEGPSLEHPETGKKLVAGDQRTGQASGRLSANLAVRGKKTASRTNNGFKK